MKLGRNKEPDCRRIRRSLPGGWSGAGRALARPRAAPASYGPPAQTYARRGCPRRYHSAKPVSASSPGVSPTTT
jgi:hypothetical protein